MFHTRIDLQGHATLPPLPSSDVIVPRFCGGLDLCDDAFPLCLSVFICDALFSFTSEILVPICPRALEDLLLHFSFFFTSSTAIFVE